jgi:PHD/YefM family antitoxin component YafN of YafNO toxin-antitoxin module
MLDLKLFENVKYVVDNQGKKAAVQVDLKDWQALLDYLEDLEDQALVKEKLSQLQKGPAASGAIKWQDAKSEW